MTETPSDAPPARSPELFAARRLTVRQGGRVRHFQLGRGAQAAAAAGLAALVLWSGVSALALGAAGIERAALTARVASLESARAAAEAALAERHAAALARAEAAAAAELAALRRERDALAAEAEDGRTRLATLSAELTERQTRLMAAEDAEAELALALETLRARLRDAVEEREAAERTAAAATLDLDEAERRAAAVDAAEDDWTETIAAVTLALEDAAAARDAAEAERREAAGALAALEAEREAENAMRLRLYDRLEDAVQAGLGGLERAVEGVGVDPERVVRELREDYAGEGGPFVPVLVSGDAAPAAVSADAARVAALLGGLERASLMQVAAAKLPLARPVRAAHRFTSGFGARRDPFNGRMRMHSGIDLAAAHGTPIHATADGVVTFAGWQSGYGRVVKIRHAFGFETVYAHLARARVSVGDRLAQGDRIGDMGSSGRSTGVHLHYEIRTDGRPVNPVKYIEAARNVL